MQRSQNASKQRMFYRCTSYLFLIAAVFYGATLFTGFNATAQNDSGQPEARTESGRVIGSTVNGVNEFLGIPYAAPPVGNLRWMPPQPYGPFPGYTLQATQFGSECPQPGGGSASSENCLFLNVYTPQFQAGDDDDNRGYGPRHDEGDQDGGWQRRDMRGNRRHRGLPVMVWMPGGALEVGTGAEYDPSQLVKQGIIVVTINYRLGYLGFFAQSAIDAEGHLNGNYGFMDQQFALKWVRRNIAGFGGDPDNVTISGESAGGQSVLAQLASPLAAGLFRKAISESGAYGQFQDYYNYIIPLAQGETTGSSGVAAVPSGAEVAKLVGCTNQTAACLRAVPAATLSALEPPLAIFPFVDGTLLPQTPTAALASGAFNRVPVLTGSNHDEWRYYVALEYDAIGHPIVNSAEYDAAVTGLEGPTLEPTLVSLYPYSDYQFGGEAMGAVGTDGVFSCPALKSYKALSKYVPTYVYEFNDENAPQPQGIVDGVLPFPTPAPGGLLTFPMGSFHSAELQYLFHIDGVITFGPLSAEQTQLSEAMTRYWTQFVKTGDPNSPDEPAWSPYNASIGEVQSLVTPTPVVDSNFDAEHKCSTFWDTF